MDNPARHSSAETVVYGLLIIVPVAVVFLLLVKLTEILEKLAAPLGLKSSLGAAIALCIAIVVAVFAVLSLSWIVGSIMRRVISYKKFESAILNQIPGYQIIANIAKGFSEGGTSYPPVLLELHGPGVAVLGFVMEEHPSGQVTVYVPSVPVLTVGNIFLVERERITPLKAGATEVADCISQWGMGSKKIFAGSEKSPGTQATSQ
jgi:uncharacterized membrane protein